MRRLRHGGGTHWAPVCSTWVWMSRSRSHSLRLCTCCSLFVRRACRVQAACKGEATDILNSIFPESSTLLCACV
eukprot:10978639-Alexandrium_andersonii.AAC.1